MQANELKVTLSILEYATVFLVGPEIGIEKAAALLIITMINTIIWISMRKTYGTTVGRILKKQGLELLVTVGLIFALRIVFEALNIRGFEVLVFYALIGRQIFFTVLIAKQVFLDHDLDNDNVVTNMTFGKIIRSLTEVFKFDTKDGNIDNPLTGGNINAHEERHTQNLKIDNVRYEEEDDKNKEPKQGVLPPGYEDTENLYDPGDDL